MFGNMKLISRVDKDIVYSLFSLSSHIVYLVNSLNYYFVITVKTIW